MHERATLSRRSALLISLAVVCVGFGASSQRAVADGRCSTSTGAVESRIAAFWQCASALGPQDQLTAEDLGQWARNVTERDSRAGIRVDDFRAATAAMQAALDRASVGIPSQPPKTTDVEQRIALFWQRASALGAAELLTAADLGQWALNVIDRDPSKRILVGDFRSATASMQAAFDRARLPPPSAIASPLGRFRIGHVGLSGYFDRRGARNGYAPGDLIRTLTDFDPVVGTTVAAEIGKQLDAMHAMGVKSFTMELRDAPAQDPADFTFVPPLCPHARNSGLTFPQPTRQELDNLVAFLGLAASRDMTMRLWLYNGHQEDAAGSETWLRSILGAVKGRPGQDLIMIGGAPMIAYGDPTKCGIPAEPNLWFGPTQLPANYVRSALSLALAMGYPANQITAEAIVGYYNFDNEIRVDDPSFTSGHVWHSVRVLKTIFDDLRVPSDQRVYPLSFYEHRRCLRPGDRGTPAANCTDADPHTWANEVLRKVLDIIRDDAGARVIVAETGTQEQPLTDWSAEHAYESLTDLCEQYGISDVTFWFWATSRDDIEAQVGTYYMPPIKRRGVAFSYNAVQRELLDAAGYHLALVPNGSFEDGDALPANWTISGDGAGSRYHLSAEPGQPEVIARGEYCLRIVTGKAATSAATNRIAVAPTTIYTTTANLRFAWTGDPNPSAAPEARPRVFIRIRYFTESGTPSGLKASDTFRYVQEDSTSGFGTFPVQYQTPSDARFVQVEIGAARNGLPNPITLDVDNVR